LSFRVIIPARYESTRLPGKPLREMAGKPMIQHVYDRATCSEAAQVIIATDDARIQQAAEGFGATVCMTSTQHRSGTERLAEVIETLQIDDDEIIVNVQGDEPLMPTVCINQVANALANTQQASVATLCTPITSHHQLFDPHVVKLVRDTNNMALYFSRAPIPWHREEFATEPDSLPSDNTPYFRHIGLYAYRAGYIREYVNLAVCDLEQAESLEQLRVIFHGGRIVCVEAHEVPGPGVDTEADLEMVVALFDDGM
jgi:3-deoxy-manno-octulosonate cytidylyltransferase (CMP-KDO synthetase)